MKVFQRAITNMFILYGFSDAIRLFCNYIRILVKNRLPIREKNYMERLLSYTVTFSRRVTFLGQLHEIFLDRTYFPHSKKVKVIFDCGSNIGMSVLYFKWMYPTVRIICFEPNPEAIKFLQKNISQNNLSDISVFPYAIGKREETLKLWIETDVEASVGSTIIHANTPDHFRTKSVPVRVVRLSDYISSHVDFLKLDIEGAEGQVIENLNETGKLSLIDELCIEYHFDAEFLNYPFERIITILKDNGFFCSYDPSINFFKHQAGGKMITSIINARRK